MRRSNKIQNIEIISRCGPRQGNTGSTQVLNESGTCRPYIGHPSVDKPGDMRVFPTPELKTPHLSSKASNPDTWCQWNEPI
jgi:hypothetical protein